MLGVRPLLRSTATDAWVQADAGWDAVRRIGARFDPVQSRWFGDLLSIARDSLLSGTAGDWLMLDPIESAVLWPHLAAAAQAGIPLVATERNTRLALSTDVRIGAVLAEDRRGLRLAAEVEIDGETFPAEGVRAIGSTGVHAHRVEARTILLRVGEAMLTRPLRALIAAGGSLRVPAAERDDFFREAYPALARRSAVRAAGGLVLPAPPHPRPSLSIAYGADDTVDYRFAWEYEGLGRFPLGVQEADDARRDRDAEAEARAQLEAAWAMTTEASFRVAATLHGADAAEFVTRVVPALEEHGVTTIVTGTPRGYHELTGEPEITISTVESSDPDWFDLGVIVHIEGKAIPFQPLFKALALRWTKLKLVDDSWFSLTHPALDRLRALLDEAAELREWESGPRIARTQLALWADFEDLAHESLPALAWREAVEGLRGLDAVAEVPVPAAIRAELRPYQREGLNRLALWWRHRLGGILADDMGLGKTLQLLALIAHAREQEPDAPPFLVVAPTSVLPTWAQEAARFAPSLKVVMLDRTRGSRRSPVKEKIAGADIVVTSYAILRLDEHEFVAQPWSGVVLDEAQNVKNPATRVHQAAARLKSRAVYAATGTPMENSLAELWALLTLTAPGLFPSARRFREEYIQPIEQGKVPENEDGSPYRQARIERLRSRIRPFVLRRTKEVVAPELPERQEQTLRIELSPAHRARYDAVLQRERQKVLGLLTDLDRNRFIVFRSLTLLRMLSLAPGLIEPDDEKLGSRKLDALVDRVRELRAEGHRVLVFSQFTSFLKQARRRLESSGLSTVYLDGATRNREKVIDEFRSGDQTAFLLSLKAGGTGITLTEADYVFLLDPWWNPAAEAQAADRTHRIGQTERVFVYRMIAAGTIEEKVLDLQQRKARLSAAVMDGEDLFAQNLTADDIRGLLA
ncbi:DEAD/DEAH box helicase [Microbacterium pseudoresistens]|uniref:Superfamily II DNA or RNA helicase n=1 Tax=Microbacterium pseudoresistens TaxID=640634 RepID=A0A7Y9JN32_9MICO|nr:DEAD/DEAH box helicase [Microbacterium pseudoresistens]NYD55477.1 superfamily II DNA or RNA helicase [Microbacterium pseudoresistens]